MIIFTHFGYSSYLEWTLRCARRTNPKVRCILIGDAENKDVASRCGFEHFDLNDFSSLKRSRFNEVFKHVQGVQHVSVRNGRDWLRYVFERWFVVHEFIRREGVADFWHFDSDTMILEDLQKYKPALIFVDSTTQCNDSCLNGLIRAPVVDDYVKKIISLFEDVAFLAEQQAEFDTLHPGFAFTEMRAFLEYKKNSGRNFLSLQKFNTSVVFDDCICQEHGYKMIEMPFGRSVKAISFSNEICYVENNAGDAVRFVTLNLSWVPVHIFKWVYETRFREIVGPAYDENAV